MIKNPDFGVGGNKAQAFYVFWVLENFSSQENTLKQQDIIDILAKYGYKAERKSISNDLDVLQKIGYDIQGHGEQYDDYGNIIPTPRGKIWLKKDISDEKLQVLIDTVLFSNYIGKAEAEELIDYLLSLGSDNLKDNKSAIARINGGQVYHQDDAGIFEEIKIIRKSMNPAKKETKKRVSFEYSKHEYKDGKIVLGEGKTHIVSPYFFVSKKGYYYLVGYDHKKESIWHYRLDHVKNVKILKDVIMDQEKTELKGKAIGVYVNEHPYMCLGEIEEIELRVPSNNLSVIVENFGSYRVGKSDGDYTIVKIACTIEDAFRFAVQYGGQVEVLKPQKLRNAIRTHVEGMAMKYYNFDSDRYSEAIRKAIRTRVLDLSGIDLKGKKEHQELKRITKVYLSNNNINNVDFLKEYTSMQELHLENNDITDLSCLKNLSGLKNLTLRNLKLKNIDFVEDKYYTNLVLGLNEETDYSALLKIKNKEGLKFDAYCNSIPWAELDEKGFSYDVKWKLEEKEYFKPQFFRETFPFNFLTDAFGSWSIIPEKIEEVKIEVEKIFNKFNATEKRYLELYYKDIVTDEEELRNELKISEIEYTKLVDNVNSKIVHPTINEGLKKYFIDGALTGKFQNTDVIFSTMSLKDALEKKKK